MFHILTFPVFDSYYRNGYELKKTINLILMVHALLYSYNGDLSFRAVSGNLKYRFNEQIDMKKLKVLILEKSVEDYQSIRNELLSAGLDFQSSRVESHREFEQVLEEMRPDLILEDFDSTFSGLDILHLVKKKAPTVPVIVLTGFLDEKDVASILQAGAADYVMKGNLLRLRSVAKSVVDRKNLHDELIMLEQTVSSAYSEITQQVEERTSELQILNTALKRALTERISLEAQLRKSEAMYRDLLESANSVILRITPKGEIVYVNRFGAEFFGYTVSEFSGMHVGELVPQRDLTGGDRASHRKEIFDNPAHYLTSNSENVRKNGEHVWVAWTSKAITDDKGRLFEYLIIGNDITDRIQAENALQEQNRQIQLLLENAPDIITRFDRRLRHLYVNPAGARAAGLPQEMMIGKSNRMLNLPQEKVTLWEKQLRTVFEKGKELVFEFDFPGPTGDRYYMSKLVPEYDEQGKVLTVLGIITDVTERKRAENAIKKQSRKVEQANRELLQINGELDRLNARLREMSQRKNDFVSMASHELKTPLTSIIAFAQTLQTEQIVLTEEERRRFLKIIETEGMRLAIILNDLLDISKIEAGVMELNKTRFDLIGLIKSVLEIQQIPSSVELSIKTEVTPVLVDADNNRIRQVITNFIDNAITYGNGKITIGTKIQNEMAHVYVTDNGPGVSPEEQVKIFERFYRSKNLKMKKKKGSGLGLAISKGIIEAHKGQIGVLSEPGKGSTFYFAIPCILQK